MLVKVLAYNFAAVILLFGINAAEKLVYIETFPPASVPNKLFGVNYYNYVDVILLFYILDPEIVLSFINKLVILPYYKVEFAYTIGITF